MQCRIVAQVFLILFSLITWLPADEREDRQEIAIQPVMGMNAEFHSIHSYNLTCPESPDGQWLLFFRSTTEDAHQGDVCLQSRKNGKVRTLARDVEVQDAHRVACQQWARGGRSVVFQDLRGGVSVVVAVDVETLKETILGRERQVAFGPAEAETVALYGQHWAPARYADLELVDVATGKSRPVLSIDSVKPAYSKTGYAAYLDKKFGSRKTTLFFPNISPNQQRLFFKLSSPNGGGVRERIGSGGGSDRAGIFFYDISKREYLFIHSKWGHPAWHPDSKHIVNMWSNGAVLIDVETGAIKHKLAQPDNLRPGGHPSVAPDGRTFVTDGIVLDGKKRSRRWGVYVGNFDRQQWKLIHEFDNSKGAKSWRVSHPHPVFSRDGRRIYFNVSEDNWTRLFVAELGETKEQR